jgi:hypothetical protein
MLASYAQETEFVRAPDLRDELDWVMVSSAKLLVHAYPTLSGSSGACLLHFTSAQRPGSRNNADSLNRYLTASLPNLTRKSQALL